ncbi:MAG TPA: FliA/WhiG family RNA polymerase sigma factor [Solirubrobacteraceae bacterium]|nr:FliA/WhiG family RNA polymerase sigma factor [Solirubrobacteraceae bacterium]
MSTAKISNAQRDVHARRVWDEYRRTGDPRHRDRLVAMYSPLVRSIAFEKVREVPSYLDVDDLVSAGIIGLIEAIERWDPTKGVVLANFAWSRVHGAILDELRKQDWAPRRLRRRERDLMLARQRVNARLGRSPTDQDLADELGVTPERIAETRRDVVRADIESLNIHSKRKGGNPEPGEIEEDRIETIPDTTTPSPAETTATGELHDHLRDALEALSERDRRLAHLIYVEALTQREVAARLGVTESRVSQMHSQMRNRLRLALAEHRDAFRATA